MRRRAVYPNDPVTLLTWGEDTPGSLRVHREVRDSQGPASGVQARWNPALGICDLKISFVFIGDAESSAG